MELQLLLLLHERLLEPLVNHAAGRRKTSEVGEEEEEEDRKMLARHNLHTTEAAATVGCPQPFDNGHSPGSMFVCTVDSDMAAAAAATARSLAQWTSCTHN